MREYKHYNDISDFYILPTIRICRNWMIVTKNIELQIHIFGIHLMWRWIE